MGGVSGSDRRNKQRALFPYPLICAYSSSHPVCGACPLTSIVEEVAA